MADYDDRRTRERGHWRDRPWRGGDDRPRREPVREGGRPGREARYDEHYGQFGGWGPAHERELSPEDEARRGRYAGYGSPGQYLYRSVYGYGPRRPGPPDYHPEERGWTDRAGDEIASWLGDEEAARRRQLDATREEGPHRGRGPRGYRRSDERIWEEVNDRLMDDHWVDASDVEVRVRDGEVTLEGMVENRYARRRAEDIADTVPGVTHVQNNLRARDRGPTGTRAYGP